MRGRLRRITKQLGCAFCACLGVVTGCSTANFESATQQDDAASGSLDGAVDSDVPGDASLADAAASSCKDEAGKAKFCFTVELASPSHPTYDTSSGASELQIDGRGHVYVLLYNQDPASSATVKPIATVEFPPPERVGEELGIDSDLPLTAAGSAPAGTYWAIALFADNKTVKRGTGEDGLVPGDFVVVPEVVDKKAKYPTVTLEAGKTMFARLQLKPYRRVTAKVSVSASLQSAAKANTAIHGDGPMLFGIYDGDILKAGTPLTSVATVPCLNVNLTATKPGAVTSFGTAVDGNHAVVGLLFDYSTDGFPGRGTLYASLDPATAPRVSLGATSWVATTEVVLGDVWDAFPATDARTDPLKCP